MLFPEADAARKRELILFQKQSGLRFRRINLLNLAFSHRSFTNEQTLPVDNNEKLEFLGDSILGMVVSEYLFLTLSDHGEGDYARIKSVVVSEESLSSMALRLRIDSYILIGKGEEYSGGRKKKAILADCLEALIGAWYLDSGLKAARQFILGLIVPEIEKVLADKHKKDYKTLLQEYAQKVFRTYPEYQVVKKTGPDHNREFWVEVAVDGTVYGPGKGKNKKAAEQEAAGIAFAAIAAAEVNTQD